MKNTVEKKSLKGKKGNFNPGGKMISVFPYSINGKHYYTLRQIAGVLDITTPTLYQALSQWTLPSYVIQEREGIKNFKSKMIPSSIAEDFCRKYESLSHKSSSPDVIISTLQKLFSSYSQSKAEKENSTTQKVKNVSKRIFTVLG